MRFADRTGHLADPSFLAEYKPVRALVGAPSPTLPSSHMRMLDFFDEQVILDQPGQTCTAHGIANGIYARLLAEGETVQGFPSPTFIFANACIEGKYSGEEGSRPVDAYAAISKVGYCGVAVCPNDESELVRLVNGGLAYRHPSLAAYLQAHDQRTLEAYRIYDGPIVAQNVKTALLSDFPVTLAFRVDRSFEDLKPGELWKGPQSTILGGHYVCAVAYDEYGVRIVNSWGNTWADGGIGYVAWGAVTSPIVCSDRYALAFAEET